MTRIFGLLAVMCGGAAPVGALAQTAAIDESVVAACMMQSADVAGGCIGEAAGICMHQTEGGFSTVGMADCTVAETAVWDAHLNAIYKDLRAELRVADENDTQGGVSRADALRDAQRAWITYRDTECALNWALYQEGTIRTTLHTGCVLDMTAQRVLDLRGYQEGLLQ